MSNQYKVEDFFQRAITAHLPPPLFEKLQKTTVLMAGVGGGSNIAELMVRKGFGHIIIADLDKYEPHNIRQRCSLVSTLGKEKVLATLERLLDVHPFVKVTPVREGITLENVEELVTKAQVIVDMLDLHAIKEKVALHRVARKQGKFILTAPSAINGAVLWIFTPDGITFEEWSGYEERMELKDLAVKLIKRAIPRFTEEAPEEMYKAAARFERTLPLDAVGVEQAAVMTTAAAENIVLGRLDRIITLPRGLQIDTSNPNCMVTIADLSKEFEVTKC